jgi:hypothetical protein
MSVSSIGRDVHIVFVLGQLALLTPHAQPIFAAMDFLVWLHYLLAVVAQPQTRRSVVRRLVKK